MNVERKLQINLAIMVALGSSLLAIAQSNYGLPLAGAASAFVALIFTDIRQSFRLNRLLANTVALAAVVVVLLEFVTAAERNQLNTIANLLVSLQIILLFLEKTPRIYGNLAVLSLFQVAVSTAMRVDVEFGILLLVYMVVAVSFLAMLFNFRTLRSVAPTPPQAGQGGAPRRQAATPVSSTPLAILFGQPPRAQFLFREEEFSRQLTGWRLPRQVAGICFATLLFSVILFVSLPRSHGNPRLSLNHSRTVGIPDSEVTLDEMRNIIASDDPVMRVRFDDAATGQPYRVFGELYLRGVIFDRYLYDERRGVYVWRSSRDETTTRLPEPPRGVPGVIEHVVLQPQETSALFSVFPAYQVPLSHDRLLFDTNSKRLVRAPTNTLSPPSGIYRYDVFTTAMHNNLQRPVTPHELLTMYPSDFDGQLVGRRRYEFFREEFREEFQEEIDRLRFIIRGDFPHICRLADEVVEELRVTDPQPDTASIARALQNNFRFSTEYTYTLKFSQVQRTPGMDPLEDFVANHRQGHCEYFAGALVLALRSQGIPARMVVGYHGGEYNSLGKSYQIRQSDAHAWVEAYLEPGELDKSQRPPEPSPYGFWLRLDPTPPGADEGGLSQQRGMLAWANEAYGFARLMWMDYVVNMDSQRQQDAIFRPLVNSNQAAEQLLSLGGDDSDSDADAGDADDTSNSRAAAVWRIALGTVVLLIAVIAAYRISRSIRGLLKRREKRRLEEQTRHGRRGAPVPFYDRFAELLARYNLARAPSQTQSEFAAHVAERLAVTPQMSELAPLPRRVAEAFYDVRFGGRKLSPDRLSEIDQDLDRLDAAFVSAQHAARQTAGRHRPATPASPPHPRDNGRSSNTAS
jgi:transglutaminase-like putative cysteine protease